MLQTIGKLLKRAGTRLDPPPPRDPNIGRGKDLVHKVLCDFGVEVGNDPCGGACTLDDPWPVVKWPCNHRNPDQETARVEQALRKAGLTSFHIDIRYTFIFDHPDALLHNTFIYVHWYGYDEGHDAKVLARWVP